MLRNVKCQHICDLQKCMTTIILVFGKFLQVCSHYCSFDSLNWVYRSAKSSSCGAHHVLRLAGSS